MASFASRTLLPRYPASALPKTENQDTKRPVSSLVDAAGGEQSLGAEPQSYRMQVLAAWHTLPYLVLRACFDLRLRYGAGGKMNALHTQRKYDTARPLGNYISRPLSDH